MNPFKPHHLYVMVLVKLKGIRGRLERNEDIGILWYYHGDGKNKYITISPHLVNLPRIPLNISCSIVKG